MQKYISIVGRAVIALLLATTLYHACAGGPHFMDQGQTTPWYGVQPTQTTGGTIVWAAERESPHNRQRAENSQLNSRCPRDQSASGSVAAENTINMAMV